MTEPVGSDSHLDETDELRQRLEQLPLTQHVAEFDRVIKDLNDELSLDT